MKLRADFTRKGLVVFMLVLVGTPITGFTISEFVPFEFKDRVISISYLLTGVFVGMILGILLKAENVKFGSTIIKVTEKNA